MGAKGILIRDLVLVLIPDVGERLAEVTGGYLMGSVWMLQVSHPTGLSDRVVAGRLHWLPAHVKATQVRVVYRRAVR